MMLNNNEMDHLKRKERYWWRLLLVLIGIAAFCQFTFGMKIMADPPVFKVIWPYLAAIVVVSITTAITIKYLYKSKREYVNEHLALALYLKELRSECQDKLVVWECEQIDG